jgi:hypothetical protein
VAILGEVHQTERLISPCYGQKFRSSFESGMFRRSGRALLEPTLEQRDGFDFKSLRDLTENCATRQS